MDENKVTNGANEQKRPAPPPMVKKEPAPKKGTNKKLFILIPIIAIVVIALVVAITMAIKNGDKNKVKEETTLGGIVVTDNYGVPLTNEQGEPITVIHESEVHEYTGLNGEKKTTVVYKDVTLNVAVTDGKGENVTDKKGQTVTEQIVVKPTVRPDGTIIVGTTAIPVTDGLGNTAVDNQGNIFTTVVELTSIPSIVKPVDIEWKNSIGGTVADYVSTIETLKDGSYITATVTNSVDGDFGKYKELGYSRPYTVLTRYSKNGDASWQIAVGSKRGATIITDIVATDDGGFYAVGYGKNIGGVTGKGYYDGTVYKFSKKGDQEWNKIFGTSTVDIFNGGALSKDGGIIVAGSVGNNDFDAEDFGKPELKSAAAIVKYNPDGSLAWKNVVGGDKDSFTGVAEDIDGNIFCVGNFYSGELFKNRGSSDGGIVKFTSAGKFVQATCIGGTGIDSLNGITACKTGGIVVVGKSNSSDAGTTDSSFVGDLAARGGYDSYIFKYNSDLNLSFSKALRGQNNDDLTCVVETENGDLIVAGSSNSATRDFKGVTTRGGDDIVIACFDKFGDLSWVRSFGGTKDESANAICLGSDGGYLVAGRTLSKDIDMKGIAQYVTDKSVGVIVKFPE